MTSKIIRNDFTGLNNFVKGISERSVVKVGIFGRKAKRKQGVLTNAEVGAIHEFGSFSAHIPPRSFLRLPLLQRSETIIAEASEGALEKLAKGEFTKLLGGLGKAAERAILFAFDSCGFGSWVPLKWRKGSPLVDTGQLRRSITSKVERRD